VRVARDVDRCYRRLLVAVVKLCVLISFIPGTLISHFGNVLVPGIGIFSLGENMQRSRVTLLVGA
jgi:hypothetical protein